MRRKPQRDLRLDLRREDGSLPLAMLAAIIVAGLTTLLVSRTIAGQSSARFDRDFTEVLHGADAGVEQALYELNYTDLKTSVNVGAAVTTGGVTCDPTAPPQTIDQTDVQWCVQRTAARTWTLTSTGELNNITRRVVVEITERPKFFGAFGDVLVSSNGNNSVDSYNSDPACAPSPGPTCGWGSDANGDGVLDGTGNGAIGSNYDLELQGTSTRVDKTYLFNWHDNPGAGATADQNVDPGGSRCDHTSGGSGEGAACRAAALTRDPEDRLVLKPLDVSSERSRQDITNALNHCRSYRAPLQDWVASAPPAGFTTGVLTPYDAPDSEPQVRLGRELQDADFHCFKSMTFDVDTVLASASADDPVVIFVEDFVRIPNPHTKINCTRPDGGECVHRSDVPVAKALQINSEGGDVGIKSGSSVAAAIRAPLAICTGGNSSGGATVDIYGSIVCGSLNNVGNWNFHFDDALAGEGTGLFDVSRYQEDHA